MESSGQLRVFLDTNVIYSGLSSRGGTTASLLDLAGRRVFRVVLSRAVLSELITNLRRKAPRALLGIEGFLGAASVDIVQTPPASAVRVWTERGLVKDARIAAAAALAKVDYLCTGDTKLREVVAAHHDGPTVLSPRELLDLLTV